MTLRKSIVIASVAAIVAAAPAFAGEQSGVAVRYGDLNLARHAGAEVLVGRLWQAAKQVCGTQHFPSDLHTQAVVQACAQASLGRAVADVGKPVVSDVYRQRFGKPLNLAGN